MRTAEAVSPGHPDKISDQISDAVLDDILSQDPDARVAIETMGGHGIITITGEVTTTAFCYFDKIAKKVYKDLGYTDEIGVQVNVVGQSPDIAQGVDTGGAGDQGIMVGYACNENEEMIPQELYLARKILKEVLELGYGPDGKSQVTIDNEGYLEQVVVSVQHKENDKDVKEKIAGCVLMNNLGFTKNGSFTTIINGTGKFVQGGFDADTGLTGRKIVNDAYGPQVPVGGGAFCLDGETEFLSPTGWVKLANYDGELVGEYDEDGGVTFEKPKKYIKEKCEVMNRLEGRGLDMMLTDNHRFVYVTSKMNIDIKSFAEVKEQHEKSELGFYGMVIPHFYYSEGEGIPLSDDEIRLQLAYIADGSKDHNKARFRLLRPRKIKRLQHILQSLGYDYDVRQYADGYTYIYTNVPSLDKTVPNSWYQATMSQQGIIADEVVKWDGDNARTYRTTNKSNADFIQFIFTNFWGRKCSILKDDRIGEEYNDRYVRKSICYQVTAGKVRFVGLKRHDGKKIQITQEKPSDGFQYCFKTSTGMFVARRNDNIFVTGNSGKDPSKVDRSAAYMARKIAVDLLKKYNAGEVTTKIAYSIGIAQPLMVTAELRFADGRIDNIELKDDLYDLTPQGIIKALDLKKPIYQKTAEWGAFGTGQGWDK